MFQTSNKATSLFLGLARFLNQDCVANVELVLLGLARMEVRATQDIQVSEDITILYNDHYFNDDNGNSKCFYKTCKDRQ